MTELLPLKVFLFTLWHSDKQPINLFNLQEDYWLKRPRTWKLRIPYKVVFPCQCIMTWRDKLIENSRRIYTTKRYSQKSNTCDSHNQDNQAQGYKTFSMLNSVEHEILMLKRIKISSNSAFIGSDKPRMLFFPLIHVMIVGILTSMSRKNFMLSWVEHEKSFITLGPGPNWLKHL